MKRLFAIAIFAIVFAVSMTIPNKEKQLCKGFALCVSGEVDRVIDGDTLSINGSVIRLALVDAPEKDEKGYAESRLFVQSLCDSDAIGDQDDRQLYDKYGRIIAVVHCQSKNLNAELLRNGLAVIDARFCAGSEFQNDEWAKTYGC